MAEQLAKNLWRLTIPLVVNPLKELNSYLIIGKRNLLIDTGFRTDSCLEAMQKQLQEINVDLNTTDIFLTHVHYDHIGLATTLHRDNCKIYISTVDGKILSRVQTDSFWDARYQSCIENGFTNEETSNLWYSNPAQINGPDPSARYTYLENGTHLNYGGLSLECLATPGHTPGHFCLYCAENKWLFSGDHILFHISPNICNWEGVSDSLGDYLTSLKMTRNLPIKKLFPAHRRETGNAIQRIDELLKHHDRRLATALQIVQSFPGLTPYQIASKMQWNIHAKDWKDFPLNQKFFATGEACSHLDYLLVRNKIRKEFRNGKYHFYSNQSQNHDT